MPPKGKKAKKSPTLPFTRKLALHQWLLSLFGVERFDQLAEYLKDETLEGMDENNVHRFHHALCLHLPVEKRPELPDELLLEYDQAIVSVTQRLNERRITRGEQPIVWKYFQYLARLFTEIHLDRYFRDPRAMLLAPNERIAKLNEGREESDRIAALDETTDAWPQLNKIAFWMATGSGKTLLIHAHILQYRRFLGAHGRTRELNRIILLPPNEGLSQQHLREFEKVGIEAEIFNKDRRGLFAGQAVEILEVTKLKEEMDEKTVAVDALEGNNLVLVDEGHRGASAGGKGAWMNVRNALCEKGFSFEYSATFGQAVKGSQSLTDLYARSTLFDYSYRWFYGDGFGKDYQILNLEDDSNAEWMKSYLTACLLAFFQQQRLHREHEAAQIIQLFGRGVRLKGIGMSLKRSARATLPEGLERPKHIETLETLNIFGIRADYMAQFRDFLEEEGLSTNDERIEFVLPTIRNLGTRPLKTVRLKKEINGVSTEFGDAFRKLGPIPTVKPPDPTREEGTAYLQKNQVVLNWYPKIQAMKSVGVSGGEADAAPNQALLTPRHVAFLDIDRLYFDLERFKVERGWHNLNLTRSGIADLLSDNTWYRLLIPDSELAFDSYEKVRTWREVAQALLRKYVERYHSFRKREWELPHLEYRDIGEDDPNFPCIVRESGPEYGYRILIAESQQEIVQKLTELKAAIEAGDLKAWEFRGIKAIWFGRHLYQPLLFLDGGVVEISPAPLNKGERRFVEDLQAFHDANPGFFAEKELDLLRNMSKGRGVGFFEAGNFHPDFIVWQLAGEHQRVAFVDPKGIRNVGLQDPKVGFHETVKEIEQRLGDPDVVHESFIVSNTPSHVMRKQWGIEKAEMARRHIVFQDEDKDTYIEAVLRAGGGAGA